MPLVESQGNEDIASIYRDSHETLELARAAYERTARSLIPSDVLDAVVSSRVKDIRSLVVKARSSRGAPRSWASITDKVGVRIVTSTRADVRAVDRALAAGPWDVVERDVKSGGAERLYYSGTHFLVSSALFSDSIGGNVLAEVQIRTRAEDAWSVVSHKLLYKGLVEPPERMRRVIARLTVLVEMFDDDVQRMFRKRRKQAAYRPARFYELLEGMYEGLVGEYGVPPADLELATMLFAQYLDVDPREAADQVRAFVASERERLESLLAERSPKRADYLDSRDWLYNMPEVLAVLERAVRVPYALADVVRDTEYEAIVRRTCAAYGAPLPE